MNSVPVAFCRDVYRLLGLSRPGYFELAVSLSGRWQAVAFQFVENVEFMSLEFGRNEGGWFYLVHKSPNDIIAPSIEQLMTLSKRYVAFSRVSAVETPLGQHRVVHCSREDLILRLAPLVRARLRPGSSFDIEDSCPQDVALTAFEMFGTSSTFCHMAIPYNGAASEEFLCAQMDKNPRIKRLYLYNAWPHSEALEERFKKLLVTNTVEMFELPQLPKGDCVGATFTSAMFMAFFDVWVSAKDDRKMCLRGTASGATGSPLEEVLAIPLPQKMKRKVKKAPIGYTEVENSVLVTWKKPNGWRLCYLIDQDGSNFVRIYTKKR
uniref:F-box domain-containing protein n=1 Tax=Steinernema glaseri TaxID=37863 RepID=A0A1I7YVU1_9BILA